MKLLVSITLFGLALLPQSGFAQARPAAPVDVVEDSIPRVTISQVINIDSPRQFVDAAVFTVPTGHRLLVDYVSLMLDAVHVGGSAGQPFLARVGPFILGLMEGIDVTTRGAPLRFVGKSLPVSFGPGQQVTVFVSPQLSSVELDFGFLQVSLAGRLVSEP